MSHEISPENAAFGLESSHPFMALEGTIVDPLTLGRTPLLQCHCSVISPGATGLASLLVPLPVPLEFEPGAASRQASGDVHSVLLPLLRRVPVEMSVDSRKAQQ